MTNTTVIESSIEGAYHTEHAAIAATKGAGHVRANWANAAAPVHAFIPGPKGGPKTIGQVADYRHDEHAAARWAVERGQKYYVISAVYDADRQKVTDDVSAAAPGFVYVVTGPFVRE